MKKLVDYDSNDSDAENEKTDLKENEKKQISTGKRKINYNNLPIKNPIKIQKLEDLKESSSPKLKNINETEKKNKSGFVLSQPKHSKQQISYILNYNNEKEKKEDKKEEEQDYSTEKDDPLFLKKTNFFKKKEENIENYDKDEDIQKIKNAFGGKDGKKLKEKDISITEINNFDWKLHREQKKMKDDLTKINSSSKLSYSRMQKNKHQLTYLAYDAITKQDELEDRLAQQRMSTRSTQMKYGW